MNISVILVQITIAILVIYEHKSHLTQVIKRNGNEICYYKRYCNLAFVCKNFRIVMQDASY